MLKQNDVMEITKLFELELNSLAKISRIERLKMRKKVNRIISSHAMGAPNPKAFLFIVDDKLSKLISLFRDENGFRKRLERLLNEKMKKGY